jgi:hypothetical protein
MFPDTPHGIFRTDAINNPWNDDFTVKTGLLRNKRWTFSQEEWWRQARHILRIRNIE